MICQICTVSTPQLNFAVDQVLQVELEVMSSLAAFNHGDNHPKVLGYILHWICDGYSSGFASHPTNKVLTS